MLSVAENTKYHSTSAGLAASPHAPATPALGPGGGVGLLTNWSARHQSPLRSLENNIDLGNGQTVAHGSLNVTPGTAKKMTPKTGESRHKLDMLGSINGDLSSLCTDSGSGKMKIRSEPFADTYVVETEIGRGKYAVVKCCRHRANGKLYAAKFLRKRRKGKDCRQDIIHEVAMLETALQHPRLVDLVEVFETSHELIIVTEYAAGGELFRHVRMEDPFSEKMVMRLLRQILEGLVFLHSRNIVHLDVKPQNILLTKDLPHGNIKLCDLGFARTISSGEDIRDIIGTPDYVAPEILSYEPIHTASDMWSVGVLTYVMLTGCSPFAGDDKQETFLNISQVNLDFPHELFADVSEHAIDFISKLLVRNPTRRPTAEECLKHSWFRVCPDTPTNNHRVVTSPFGSPLGQRRALTPPSPDCLTDEPVKKCRCDDGSASNPSGVATETEASSETLLESSGSLSSSPTPTEQCMADTDRDCDAARGSGCEASGSQHEDSLCTDTPTLRPLPVTNGLSTLCHYDNDSQHSRSSPVDLSSRRADDEDCATTQSACPCQPAIIC